MENLEGKIKRSVCTRKETFMLIILPIILASIMLDS